MAQPDLLSLTGIALTAPRAVKKEVFNGTINAMAGRTARENVDALAGLPPNQSTVCRAGILLRGLAARAPYFHNGSAGDLSEVIDFNNHASASE